MQISDIESKIINFLRFPLTVAVVFIHFNISRKGISVHGINYGLDNPYWYHFIIELISNVMASISVPLFFFFSGYLFFHNGSFNKDIYKTKLLSRTKTLLVPFLLWNVIAIVFQAMKWLPALSSLFPGANKTVFIFSLKRLFNTFFCNTLSNGLFVCSTDYTMTEIVNEPYPIDVPMWYIRDLMVMIVISPIIYWCIKKGSLAYLLTSGSLWFFIRYLLPEGGYMVLLSTALFFFSWGAYYSLNIIHFTKAIKRIRYLPLIYIVIVFIDTLTIYTSHYNTALHNVGILVGIILVLSETSRIIRKQIKLPPPIQNSIFFIYAFHKIIIDDIAKVVFSILQLPDTTNIMLGCYFLIPILTICICIVTHWILMKGFPRICKLLTGGR